MAPFLDGFTLELVPHCASVSPDGWAGSHDVRPLSELGHQQASAIAEAMGSSVDAIFSSPALRCLQTVQPLARTAELSIMELDELRDTGMFAEPHQWTQGVYEPIAPAVGGAWSAGRGLRALLTMARCHPRARVVAASHGDIIPVFIAMFCATQDVPLPAIADRGGWYTLRFGADSFTVETNGPQVVVPRV